MALKDLPGSRTKIGWKRLVTSDLQHRSSYKVQPSKGAADRFDVQHHNVVAIAICILHQPMRAALNTQQPQDPHLSARCFQDVPDADGVHTLARLRPPGRHHRPLSVGHLKRTFAHGVEYDIRASQRDRTECDNPFA
jgi:hypothetical protein